MKLPDASTALNRLGRIAFASILAGLLAPIGMLLRETLELNGYSSYSVLEPLDLYIAFLVKSMTVIGGTFAALLVAMPVVWLLSRRVNTDVVYSGAAGISILIALALSFIGASGLYEYAVTAFGYVWIIGSVFAAVLFVEFGINSGIFEEVSMTEGATAVGAIIVTCLVVLFVTIGAANLGVAAASAAGVTDELAGDKPDNYVAEEQFRANYSSLADIESAEELTCDTSELKSSEPSMPVATTYHNNLSAWDANATIEHKYGENSDLELALTISSEEIGQLARVDVHHDDWTQIMTPQTRGFEKSSFTLDLAESGHQFSEPTPVDEIALDIYTVTEDGEVVRYTANLCRQEGR